jgi:hypothetical protein
MTRTPRLTMTAPRRFAVTVQSNTGLDLIFVDASTIAYARDQAQLKYGRDVRILATHVVRKGMGESRFDPHGVLARESEAQYKRHALPLAERRALEEQLVVARLVGDVAKDLHALAESHRRSRDEVPHEFGGPYHHEAMRLEAVANAYDDAAKRVDAVLAEISK